MQERLRPYQASRDTMRALKEFDQQIVNSGLEMSLVELVKTRASQINGCAYCIHMHARAARALGETEERLYLLDAWRESPLYTERERAALAWTDALTNIAQTHAPDEDFVRLREHFTDEEIVKLTVLIGSINVWNRVQIGFRALHAMPSVTTEESNN